MVFEVDDEILVAFPLLDLKVDGAHVVEATSQQQVDEFYGVAIIFVQIIGAMDGVDDLSKDQLSLQAL